MDGSRWRIEQTDRVWQVVGVYGDSTHRAVMFYCWDGDGCRALGFGAGKFGKTDPVVPPIPGLTVSMHNARATYGDVQATLDANTKLSHPKIDVVLGYSLGGRQALYCATDNVVQALTINPSPSPVDVFTAWQPTQRVINWVVPG